MSGSFGYELDPRQLDDMEKEAIKKQIASYKQYCDLIHRGNYYRLTSPAHNGCTVWETASPTKEKALITAVYHQVEANPVPVRVQIQGLLDETVYSVFAGDRNYQVSGAALRQCGLVIPAAKEAYQAWQILITSESD